MRIISLLLLVIILCLLGLAIYKDLKNKPKENFNYPIKNTGLSVPIDSLLKER